MGRHDWSCRSSDDGSVRPTSDRAPVASNRTLDPSHRTLAYSHLSLTVRTPRRLHTVGHEHV